MNNKNKLNYFNDIYEKTYGNILKYTILHCNDLDDVKDIIQDTYMDFYKYMLKKNIDVIEDIDNYIIGIAKNNLKKYYRFKSKKTNIELLNKNEDIEMLIDTKNDLELNFITSENVQIIWDYIKKKNVNIAKIFYAYYHLDMKINEIALEMQINESTVKNYIYRTIKEIKKYVMED